LITVKCCLKLNTCSPNKQTNTYNVSKTQTIIMCPTRKQHQRLTQIFLLLQEKHHTRMLLFISIYFWKKPRHLSQVVVYNVHRGYVKK
jgi:hypothetical protein